MVDARLCIAPLLLILGACDDMCGNQIVTRLPGPDGTRDAVMFQRDCGATSGFTTQISIVESGEGISGIGNAYTADDDHGRAAAGAWHGPWAAMEWRGPRRLHISYAAGSRIFEQNEQVSGVVISYARTDTPGQ